jgi:hypothetical protein
MSLLYQIVESCGGNHQASETCKSSGSAALVVAHCCPVFELSAWRTLVLLWLHFSPDVVSGQSARVVAPVLEMLRMFVLERCGVCCPVSW